jgi:agmatine deiminase
MGVAGVAADLGLAQPAIAEAAFAQPFATTTASTRLTQRSEAVSASAIHVAEMPTTPRDTRLISSTRTFNVEALVGNPSEQGAVNVLDGLFEPPSESRVGRRVAASAATKSPELDPHAADANPNAPKKVHTPNSSNPHAVAGTLVGAVSAMASTPAARDDLENNGPRRNPGGVRVDDPNQRLTPYSVTPEKTQEDEPNTGVIYSPPEYDPTHGVIFRYGLGYNSVVTACVAALTSDPSHDEIAYVLVTSASVQSQAEAAFASAGADLSKVVFYIQPGESVWARDYGPHFVTVDDALAIVDSHYYSSRPKDNFIPSAMGDQNLKVPTYDMGLYYSGGNFQPGPNKSAFITSLINSDNPASAGFDATFIAELYKTYQGVETLHVFPALPGSVDGTGHIDMWMYLVDEDTVIISEFKAGSNQTAINITNNAVPYMQDLGFEVIRTPAWNVGSTHYTYTNAYRVNDRIFVPVYGTAVVPGGNSAFNADDAAAMALWQQAAGPGVEVIPIQCNGIIPAAGAIHCIVMQVPRYTGSAPAVDVVSPAGGEVWLRGAPQTIQWSAIDTNNTDPVQIQVFISPDGVNGWRHLGTTTDTGSLTVNVVGRQSDNAVIKVVAKSSDGDETTAYSAPFVLRTGTEATYDFTTGGGVDKFGWGYQTSSWNTNVSGNSQPVATALSTSNYASLSVSDNSRYTATTPSSGQESTHAFSFTLAEPISVMDDIEIRWEGYAQDTTQVELYVWDLVAQQWGDGKGLSGQNRFMDNWSGYLQDGDLVGHIRSDFARYVDSNGVIRLLVYAERSADTTYHDYLSVSVTQV